MIKYYSSVKNLCLSFSLFFSKNREYENLRNEKKSLVFIMVFFSLISCFFVKAQSSVNYVLTSGPSSFNSMSGATIEEQQSNYDKIITRVAREVAIKK